MKNKVLWAGVAAILGHNMYLERSANHNLSLPFSILHAVAFFFRKLLTLIPLRLLRMGSGSKKGKKHLAPWNIAEQLAIQTLAFFAKVSRLENVNKVLAPVTRGVASYYHNTKYLNVTRMHIGISPNKKAEEAVWMSLSEDVKINDPNTVVILYFHGGGYCIGTADMYVPAYREWLLQLEKMNITAGILSIEYPLAPEHKFPIALEWAVASYDAVISLGVCPSRLIVGGDSAGGGLAIRCALHGYETERRKHKSKHIAGLVLVSPWVNHSCQSGSHLLNASHDFISGSADASVAQQLMNSYSEAYCGELEVALTDPRVSLLHLESYAGLPPTLITLGSKEVFHDDVVLFSDKAKTFNVPVSTVLGDDMPHIWPMLFPLFPKQGVHAIHEIALFCKNRVELRKGDGVTDKWSEKLSTSMKKRNLTNLNLVNMR